jgi:hypothetical protein
VPVALLLVWDAPAIAAPFELVPGDEGYVAPTLHADAAIPSAMSQVGWLVEDATRLAAFDARADVRWAHDLLVFIDGEGERTDVLGDAYAMDMSGAVGRGRFGIAAGAQLVLGSTSDVSGVQGTAVGDLRFDGRATLLDPADAPLGFAGLLRLTLPGGAAERQLGQPGRSLQAIAVAQGGWGDLVMVGNVGVDLAPAVDLEETMLGSGVVARAAVSRTVSGSLDGFAEGHLRTSFGAASDVQRDTPVELLLGLRHRGASSPAVAVIGGFGVTRGIGAPAARLAVQVGYAPTVGSAADADGPAAGATGS